MAAALYPSRNDTGPSTGTAATYQRPLMTDLDFRDNRYPSMTPQRQSTGPVDSTQWKPVAVLSSSPAWDTAPGPNNIQSSRTAPSDVSQSQSPSQEQPQKNTISYSLPPDSSRRVVERYSLDGPAPQDPLPENEDGFPTKNDPSRSNTKRSARQLSSQDPTVIPSTTPHRSTLPQPTAPVNPSHLNGYPLAPAQMPLAASPNYNPPVSSRQRAYAQQPYITQNVTPNPVNPVFLPNNGEEVCVECAMRDQDMADVDVTSPGVWDRDSDVFYEDLRRKEEEEERTGIIDTDGPPRPKYKGGLLTEQNLKIWLSLNPREPASRQQTLSKYVKSQRALLEAESVARTRAMQEARQLDDRMRDTYSQLRRSAYDMGSSAAPTDDTGGVRIKPPTSPASPLINGHERSHSREVTLLENGMIVEHVDVRKEEREARDRKRKEERRARKSSRGSVIDATSVVSAPILTTQTDSGIGLNPYSRYSQNNASRPMSVLTAPLDRGDIPRAQSQLSFTDVQSLGSLSPNRRTRFFGLMGSPWRSQDSLAASGMSGSMIDMHVALQREENQHRFVTSPDLTPARRSQLWQTTDLEQITSRQSEEKPKKKKGLAKIWGIVTRSSKNGSNSRGSNSLDRSERTEDDLPLAPPPPLSYLVNRGPGEHLSGGGARHASTPSLPSTTSPKFGLSASGISPPTAPSTNLPSPASSRQSGTDQDGAVKKHSGNADDFELQPPDSNLDNSKNIYTVISEPNLRQRMSQSPTSHSAFSPATNQPLSQSLSSRPTSSLIMREKSLPPLPGEAVPRVSPNGDPRPRTVYTFDPRQLPPGSSPPHDFVPPQAPFRNGDMRRQSFGGLTSRPNLDGIVSMSMNGRTMPGTGFGQSYDEFGNSSRSLRLGKDSPSRFSTAPVQQTKRKSRFGLSALLGRKNSTDKDPVLETHQFPPAGSDAPDEVMTGYATSTSRHSAFSMAPGPRISVTSRKALEDLVQQDSEFVAYRYPSNDQRLDLLR
ncbi:hypothetical protein K435DRAFT_774051 [Dendrothele bispora CBS 962.96]|uniref:Uncharacterized protein n=1 Tax=Dendrothele bispora (strain CBS 962.96) TaxID=1314807 RepID=A0A4V4HI32_DENBC|nr:hypothetical protein K435DRAFT_774051 [Dendrothele bispora CBS 962.96]